MKSCLDCLRCDISTNGDSTTAFCGERMWPNIVSNVRESLAIVASTADMCDKFVSYSYGGIYYVRQWLQRGSS